MRRSPRLWGLARSRWWLDGLRQALPWLSAYSHAGVCQLLKRARLRYKRGRASLHSPDLDYDRKLALVAAAQQVARQHPQRYVLVYQDELTYYRRPSVAHAYAACGHQQAQARQGYGSNRRRRIAAAVNSVTGRLSVMQRHRLDRYALIRFYRQLEADYPDAEVIFVAQDNWPVHFHPDVLAALQASRVQLLPLPTYAPWTNPVEKVWLGLYREVLHQHPFQDDWLALQQTVQAWLDQFANGSLDLLHAIGLYPY